MISSYRRGKQIYYMQINVCMSCAIQGCLPGLEFTPSGMMHYKHKSMASLELPS